ncbi:hypothetical protein D3C85_1866870 [compost metagenome]
MKYVLDTVTDRFKRVFSLLTMSRLDRVERHEEGNNPKNKERDNHECDKGSK